MTDASPKNALKGQLPGNAPKATKRIVKRSATLLALPLQPDLLLDSAYSSPVE